MGFKAGRIGGIRCARKNLRGPTFRLAAHCWRAQASYPQATRTTPASQTMRARCLELLQVEVTVPTALPQSRCALTAPFHPCLSRSKYPAIGGLLSVALFRALPRMAVSHHPVLWSPD